MIIKSMEKTQEKKTKNEYISHQGEEKISSYFI